MCLGMANGGKSLTAKEAIENVQKAGVELTKNLIVKALECCISAESCCECGYTKMCDGTTIHQFALDLINRQQAEIERLRKANDSICEAGGKLLHERRMIREKAIKEFAERLKETYNFVTSEDIDTLVKEMVGADNG